MEKFHTLWIGGRLSQMEKMALASHVAAGHEIHLWSYADLSPPPGVISEDANQILPESKIFSYKVGEGAGSYSAFSNIFRYKLILERGGWWCDSDMVCLRKFKFQDDYVFASEKQRSGWNVASCVFKCPANSGVMLFCYEQSIKRNPDLLEWGEIGPQLMDRAVRMCSLESFIVPTHLFCPVDWFVSEDDPMVTHIPDLTSSFGVHLWQELWRRKGLNKDDAYPTHCLYERLKRVVLRRFSETTGHHQLFP